MPKEDVTPIFCLFKMTIVVTELRKITDQKPAQKQTGLTTQLSD